MSFHDSLGTRLKLDQWAKIAEIVSGLAIVVSLAILVLEVRSNTEAVEAQTLFNIVSVERDQTARIIENVGGLVEIMSKVGEGETLSEIEDHRYRLYLRDRLDIWEWKYFEADQGRLDLEILDPDVWAQVWSDSPGMTEVFESMQDGRNPDWIAFIERNAVPLSMKIFAVRKKFTWISAVCRTMRCGRGCIR